MRFGCASVQALTFFPWRGSTFGLAECVRTAHSALTFATLQIITICNFSQLCSFNRYQDEDAAKNRTFEQPDAAIVEPRDQIIVNPCLIDGSVDQVAKGPALSKFFKT
ncbi:hypothetical protein BJ878DRAFT_492951 [Calycina marina]|uniref:Uncharacterized protein n=1 Tax=Calycina marina TaxID=1763456 RepID=A0A9P7Z844_9HELO|nr:hypothetical protein BJ878DRAFT_492951 [Calycina marina]